MLRAPRSWIIGDFYKLRLLNIVKYEWCFIPELCYEILAGVGHLVFQVLAPAMLHPALTSDGLAFNSSNLNEAAALIRVIC